MQEGNEFDSKDQINMEKCQRFTKEQLKYFLQIMGMKDCAGLADQIMAAILQEINGQKVCSQNQFREIISNQVKSEKISHIMKNYQLASDIVQKKLNFIILLGGPSGSGKSSIASLLGSRFAISTSILSSDSIRHILRNFQ